MHVNAYKKSLNILRLKMLRSRLRLEKSTAYQPGVPADVDMRSKNYSPITKLKYHEH